MEVNLQIINDSEDEIRISEPDEDNQICLELCNDGAEEYTSIYLNYDIALKVREWLSIQIRQMALNNCIPVTDIPPTDFKIKD